MEGGKGCGAGKARKAGKDVMRERVWGGKGGKGCEAGKARKAGRAFCIASLTEMFSYYGNMDHAFT